MTGTKLTRARALGIFRAGVAAVDGRACVRDALRDGADATHLIAIGKAAAAMTLGAHDALGDRIAAALVICPHGGAGDDLARLAMPVRVMEAGHPVPDEGSLEAGAELERFLDTAPAGARFLFLISGGASSLVEKLPEGMTLDALAGLNRWLLASGLDIGAMNRVRQAVSCIKAGRLIPRLKGRPCRALLMSDVPNDDPAVIASGLLIPAPGGPLPDVPEALRTTLRFGPPADDRAGAVTVEIVANVERALTGAGAAAKALGYRVRTSPARLEGDAAEAGERIAQTLRTGGPGVYLRGGETAVRLPPAAGRGGRCQHLALAAAIAFEGDGRFVLLAAGTDGRDGPGDYAGAIVDGGTLARGTRLGLDPRECLRRADSGTFLEAAGDLIRTGSTGTNVADLIVGIRVH